jgi:hypothetical protein
LQTDQLLRERPYPIDVIAVPPKVHPHVAAIGPTQVRKRLRERRDVSLPHGIVFVARHEHADAPYAVALLRARRKRPRSYREASARELTWRVSPNRRRCRRGYLQGCGQRQAAWRGRRVDEREAIEKGAIEFKVPATKLITVQRR